MSVIRAAGLIAILSLISKFVGLFREMAIANVYGTNYVRDAYGIASLWPAQFALVMLAGLNGPFHSSVVSVISKYKAVNNDKDTKTVIFTLSVVSCIFMTIIGFLCYWFAPQLIEFIASKDAPTITKNLAIIQFRIMSPMFLLSALIGISYGILNIEKIYFTPSLSPVMASLAVIVALYAVPTEMRPLALAWGTMIGAILQLGLQLIPMVKHLKNYIGFSFDLRHPGLRNIISILLPASLSSTIGQVNLLIMTYFASGLPEGSISSINSANFIFQLPLGIMLTALLVPMLPVLNHSVTIQDDNKTFKHNINKSMRSLIFLSVPATAIILCSGKQLIQVLFERGHFDANSTLMTYRCLAALSLGVVFYAIRDLIVRVFYALDNAKIPFYTSLFSIIVTSAACWTFVKIFHLQSAGITMATSFVTIFNMSILSFMLRKRIGQYLESETIKHLIRVILATIPVVIYCLGFNQIFGERFSVPVFALYGVLLGIVGSGSIMILRLLKDEETIQITDKFLGKFLRKLKKA